MDDLEPKGREFCGEANGQAARTLVVHELAGRLCERARSHGNHSHGNIKRCVSPNRDSNGAERNGWSGTSI
jgi:hypothetical protein